MKSYFILAIVFMAQVSSAQILNPELKDTPTYQGTTTITSGHNPNGGHPIFNLIGTILHGNYFFKGAQEINTALKVEFSILRITGNGNNILTKFHFAPEWMEPENSFLTSKRTTFDVFIDFQIVDCDGITFAKFPEMEKTKVSELVDYLSRQQVLPPLQCNLKATRVSMADEIRKDGPLWDYLDYQYLPDEHNIPLRDIISLKMVKDEQFVLTNHFAAVKNNVYLTRTAPVAEQRVREQTWASAQELVSLINGYGVKLLLSSAEPPATLVQLKKAYLRENQKEILRLIKEINRVLPQLPVQDILGIYQQINQSYDYVNNIEIKVMKANYEGLLDRKLLRHSPKVR